jgi:hypothetical protein
MATSDISARLRALATDDKRRPETARLRDVFDDVEAALKARVPQAVVLEELRSLGYSMTMASFKSALQRIRKERTNSQQDSTSQPATPGENQATASTAPEANESPDTSSLGGGLKGKAERKANQYLGGNPLDFNVSDVLTKKEKK